MSNKVQGEIMKNVVLNNRVETPNFDMDALVGLNTKQSFFFDHRNPAMAKTRRLR
jgi:hypothetical protein